MSSCSAIIQNNTLIENNFPKAVYPIKKKGSIQPNHVAFTQNKFEEALVWIESNSSAIIQNNKLIENNVSKEPVYYIMENSSIQLNHVAFTQNKLEKPLLWIE